MKEEGEKRGGTVVDNKQLRCIAPCNPKWLGAIAPRFERRHREVIRGASEVRHHCHGGLRQAAHVEHYQRAPSRAGTSALCRIHHEDPFLAAYCDSSDKRCNVVNILWHARGLHPPVRIGLTGEKPVDTHFSECSECGQSNSFPSLSSYPLFYADSFQCMKIDAE